MTGTDDRRERRLRALRTLLHGAQARALPQVKSDINVTPLVDVVLVLLIIFMVVTPLIASGVSVELPLTRHHARKPDEGKDIILSITRDSRLYVGATRVAHPEDLARAVRQEKRKHPEKGVFLKGDALAPYGAVREVLQALHEVEVEDMVLGTEEAKDRSP